MIRVGYIFGDIYDSGSTWNYLTTLAEKINSKQGFTSVGFYHSGEPNDLESSIDLTHFEKKVIPRWDRAVASEDIDIVHRDGQPLLNHIPAIRSPVPVVTTVHGSWNCPSWDEERILEERGISKWQFGCYRLVEHLSRFSYDRILSVSDHVSQAIIQRANIPEEMVKTTYEAINDEFFTQSTSGPPANSPEEYLFHVSYAGPRKNLTPVVRSLRELNDDIPLVVAGSGWQQRLVDVVQELGLEDQVQFLGYVREKELIRWLDHATIFVFPSRYETFGLPNIEAMARETPVLTSSCGAIPEIVGDAAYLLDDATDTAEIRRAIHTLLNDKKLRQTLVHHGRDRADQFKWDSHVSTITREYNALL